MPSCAGRPVLFNDSYENALDYARKRAFRNRSVCDALQAAMPVD